MPGMMMAGRSGIAALSAMIGVKRFVRHGLFVSALGHAGILAIGLLFLRASSQEAPPPDATLVELVTPQEIPHFSGTPSALRASGTEKAETPQPAQRAQNVPPQPEQQQQKQQAQAQRNPPAKQKQPPMRQAEAGEVAVPPPDPPAPAAAQTPDSAEAAAKMAQLAQLALMGGRLGGGFAAPPVDAPVVGDDFTLAFRELVSACAGPVAGIAPTDKTTIRMRIFLNRDGTLAQTPQLREPAPSAKQQAIMATFVRGLEKCQPYTMLPRDRYNQWKIIDLLVFPLNAYGG